MFFPSVLKTAATLNIVWHVGDSLGSIFGFSISLLKKWSAHSSQHLTVTTCKLRYLDSNPGGLATFLMTLCIFVVVVVSLRCTKQMAQLIIIIYYDKFTRGCIQGNMCYGLDVVWPSRVHVLGAWSPVWRCGSWWYLSEEGPLWGEVPKAVGSMPLEGIKLFLMRFQLVLMKGLIYKAQYSPTQFFLLLPASPCALPPCMFSALMSSPETSWNRCSALKSLKVWAK